MNFYFNINSFVVELSLDWLQTRADRNFVFKNDFDDLYSVERYSDFQVSVSIKDFKYVTIGEVRFFLESCNSVANAVGFNFTENSWLRPLLFALSLSYESFMFLLFEQFNAYLVELKE